MPKHVWSALFDQPGLQESGLAPLINAINGMTSELGFDKVCDDISEEPILSGFGPITFIPGRGSASCNRKVLVMANSLNHRIYRRPFNSARLSRTDLRMGSGSVTEFDRCMVILKSYLIRCLPIVRGVAIYTDHWDEVEFDSFHRTELEAFHKHNPIEFAFVHVGSPRNCLGPLHVDLG